MKRFSVTVWMMMACIGMMVSSAGAEDQVTTTDAVQMEDVVVTSTRTSQSILETPSNIGVVTSDDIEAMDADTLPDVLQKLPGVYVSNSTGFVPHLNLRGTRVGMSEGALILLNGIPMSMGKFGYVDWDAIPVENIQRVEVVKGPLSSLYGGDAARGVINIITKRSSEKMKGNVSAAFGEFDDQRYSALLYGGTEKFDYNFNVKKKEADSYRDDAAVDNWNYAADLGWWVSDASRLGFFVNVSDTEKYLPKKMTKDQREEDPRQTTDISFTDVTDVISGLSFKMNQSLWDLDATTYYKNRDKTYENYLKATSTPYEEKLEGDIWGVRSILTYKQPIFRLNNKLSVGFDYDCDQNEIEKTKGESKTEGEPYTKPYPKGSGDFTREMLGLFVQDELALLDNLTLTLGLRYDHFQYDNDAGYDFTQDGTVDYDDTPEFDEWNPRIGLNYRPTQKLSLYAAYNEAYRPLTVYDFYSTGSYADDMPNELEPEKFTQYETGFRYFFNEMLSVDISIFRIEIEDMLDSYYDKDGDYAGKQNIGKSRQQGMEASFSGSFVENRIRYKVGYTYTDARYVDSYAKDYDKNIVSIDDNRLSKIPYNRVNIDLDTTLLKRNDYQLEWHVGMMTQDDYPMDKLNTDDYQAYTLVDSKMTLKYKGFEYFIAVDNLFDEDYDNYAYISSGKEYYYPAADQTWTTGVVFEF